MRQTAAVGVIKKDILLPKPDHILAAAATPFSQLFNGADPESRASARLEVGSTSAFTFNPPATPTPFVSVPGTPVFIFGATEAASAPLDPLPRHAHQQHFRQSSIDELYEADLHARTALLAARLARAFDPTAMTWQGHRLSYAAPPLSPPTSLPLRDFRHLTYTFQLLQRNAGRMPSQGGNRSGLGLWKRAKVFSDAG